MHSHRGFFMLIFRRFVMKDNHMPPGRIGVCELLTVLFIGLKLAGIINWSWLWVLSPEWIALAVYIITSVLIAILEKF